MSMADYPALSSRWVILGISISIAFGLSGLVPAPVSNATTELSGSDQVLQPKRQPDGTHRPRSLRAFPAGNCVIEHPRRGWTDIGAFPYYRQNDYGEVVYSKDSAWYQGQDVGRSSATFNCCTFAVSIFVELTPQDWVGTAPTFDGYPTPIAVIVDSFFDRVTEFELTDSDFNAAFERHTMLKDDDLVCFERRSENANPLRRIFTHVGRVKTADGVNRLLSKFGQGPIALSDLNFPNRAYPGADVVRIYRFCGNTISPD